MKRLKNFKVVVAILFASAILLGAAVMIKSIEAKSQYGEKELNIQEQSVKNEAIQECFSAATITTKDGNTEKTEPVFYIYMLCLQDKGYTTNFK